MVRARAMGPAEGKHGAGPNGGDRPRARELATLNFRELLFHDVG
jgi:hypothetical protein